ncbi:MAG: DUF935 family protein [Methanoregulaceae archaeon]|nr:DUF935 family protein [Methanoregulaceae archaeon]
MIFKFRRKTPRREVAPTLTLPERQSLAQPGATHGLPVATYDQMQTDSMVQTALNVKKLGVLAAPWRIVAGSDAESLRRASFVAESFERMEGSPLTILFGAMDAFAKGWSLQELVYRWGDGKLWLHAVRPKDPNYYGIEVDAFGRIHDLRLRLPGEAERTLPREKFVLFAHQGGYGNPKGRSDLDAAHRHWQAKQSLLAAWRLHLERFAMPTVLAKIARGLPVEDQTALLSSLDNLHRITALLVPEEIDIDTLGGQKEPSTGFMDALDFHNREIARAILGQTLTTDEGRRVGSLAMGKVHLQVMLLQLDAIRRSLADQVMTEQVIRPLVELNFGPGPVPRFEFESSAARSFVTGEV